MVKEIADKQAETFLSVGDVARRLGCDTWHVRRLCERRLYPEPPRMGTRRMFRESELPAIRELLVNARYIK